MQKHAAGHSAPRRSGWNAGRSPAEPHLPSVDEAGLPSGDASAHLVLFSFVEAPVKKRTHEGPPSPVDTPLPLCVCDSVCATASDPREGCPASSVLPPEASPRPAAGTGLSEEWPASLLLTVLLIVSSWSEKDKCPVLTREQSQGPSGHSRNSCFELPQESQPL